MASILIEIPVDPKACRHESIEELGHETRAMFFRCAYCGSIVIAQGEHRWIIRPTDAQGPLPF